MEMEVSEEEGTVQRPSSLLVSTNKGSTNTTINSSSKDKLVINETVMEETRYPALMQKNRDRGDGVLVHTSFCQGSTCRFVFDDESRYLFLFILLL